ncbi:MAG TPA: transcription-repair coupling factor [Candidatus Eremiobacteraceae bacterium]|nr:transcription-repair coupling factor [Candidatus Eremiobacteraceae bacterium]
MAASLGPLIPRIVSNASDALARAEQAVGARAAVDVTETTAAARPALAAALWRSLGGCLIVWSATPDAADRFANDASFYLEDAGDVVHVLRPRDRAVGGLFNPTERSARIETLSGLAAGRPGIYCVSHASIRQPLPSPDRWRDASFAMRTRDDYEWEPLLARLVELGYDRVDIVSAVGEFTVRGGLIDVFAATADRPVRLEFFGDVLESIREFSLSDQRSIDSIDEITIAPWNEDALANDGAFIGEYAPSAPFMVDDAELIVAIDHGFAAERDDGTIAAADSESPETRSAASKAGASAPARAEAAEPERENILKLSGVPGAEAAGAPPELSPFALDDIAARLTKRAVVTFATAGPRVTRQADVTVALPSVPAPIFNRSMERFVTDVRARVAAGELIAIASVGHRRIREVLDEHDVAVAPPPKSWKRGDGGRVVIAEGAIDAGFEMTSLGVVVLGDAELFGHAARRQKIKAVKEGVPITEADLKAGEYFVHANHGIGQYLGLEHIVVNEVGRDFMALKYAGADRLYVPVEMMHLVRRYVAGDGSPPALSKMGGSDWARARSRVREAVEKIAEGLVRLYAQREAAQGHAFAPDTPWQAELEESFPYDETPDQRSAIEAVKADMERPRPMDRLVCGDVGYGKTEVAIRAAFKAIMDRKQVVVLVPTTVLAAQHYRTFTERFAAFPVKVGLLSRLRSKAEQKETLKQLADGGIDLVIGTHRVLQRDVGFKNLGLVIVDEEQRFGVAHKERLKEMRRSVDVLTLSATPIPRTLHMSLVGVRDLSLIQTAPSNRMSVKTVVTPTSDALIASALQQELDRGGQVYFVHNRIESIYGIRDALQALAPRARIAIGHGQMDEHELEDVMIGFVNGDFDVLVSTTIIENGLDIPNVNTIVINNADHFGLAQLYQLRGRVGRSAHQAYAYFLYQPHRALSEAAQARLEAIREFSHLGSGLRLAMRDLEIRGAGNLLGHAQSGFIAAVGFDAYCQILEDAIGELRGQPHVPDEPPPVLDLRVSAYIPNEYVRGASQKIALYQRLAAARSLEALAGVADEMRDRYGPRPKEVDALIELARLRLLAAGKGVEKLSLEGRRLTLEVGRRFSLSESSLPALTSLTRGNFRFTQGAIVAQLPPHDSAGDGKLATVREILAAL